ncbi:MAG TPA: Rieske 2Fe-2S domain-containing protein, partial [Chloroflexota bacterium]
GAYCSHRCAPLFYGRNEESGLRCVYHGWKYDVEGNVLETPGEPPLSQLKLAIHHPAYPCVEVNGLIYTYLGPAEKKPLLPAVHWLALPKEQVDVGCKFFLECNWLQSLDGDNDRMHTAYLHTRRLTNDQRFLRSGGEFTANTGVNGAAHGGPDPRSGRRVARYVTEVEADVLPYGVQGGQIFATDDPDYLFVYADTFYMPCNGMLAGGQHVIYQVPADDYTCWRYDIILNLDGPIGHEYTLNYREESWPAPGTPFPGWQKKMNRGNNYLIDRARQRSFDIYAGVDARNHTQDAMITENLGPSTPLGNIADRTRYHLGVSDNLMFGAAQMLLQAAQDVAAGKDPPGVAFKPEDNQYPRGLGGSFEMRVGDDWRKHIRTFEPTASAVSVTQSIEHNVG